MKEQIYFVSKDVETLESELYSLADFPEVRYETTKIYEFYMKGILGGTASEQKETISKSTINMSNIGKKGTNFDDFYKVLGELGVVI